MSNDAASEDANISQPTSSRIAFYTPDQRLVAGVNGGRVDFTALKETLLQLYVQETGGDPCDLDAVVKWMRVSDSPRGLQYARIPTLHFGLFTSIEDKINAASQRGCSICSRYDAFPSYVFAVRIPPVSRQMTKLIPAFRAAMADAVAAHPVSQELYDARLCVALTFVLGEKLIDQPRNKNDVDNLAKSFVDGLKKRVFRDDEQIEHLDLLRLHSRTNETFVKIRIQATNIDGLDDVVRPTTQLGWAGKKYIDLAKYL